MELTDKGIIELEKGKKQQIKCHRFKCNPIKRELMVHEDVDNKNHVSVSDCKTGYRLFALPKSISSVKPTDISERLQEFVKHFTKEGIAKEFERIENIQTQLKEDKI
jgi:hypothetical protein